MSQVPHPSPASVLVTDEGAAFQLQGELGRGGMGAVYRAFDRGLGRPVALKLSLSERASPAQLERFRREGEIAASLEHPGIVRVFSAGAVRGRPYLCFELVEGAQSLASAMGGLTREARLQALIEVGEALGFAHARGVVHRDVKPDNVLLDREGRARLTDFGVASASGQDRLTRSGTTLGTPYYASPEQLMDGHRVGPAADVWSLGVLLYEALTDELPFEGESLLSLVAKVTEGRFDPPSQLDQSVPPALEAVCLKALRRAPEERYLDGVAFAADLERARRGEATEAPQRRGAGRLLAGLGAAGLAALGGALWFARGAPEAPTLPTPGATARATPRPTPQRRATVAEALAARDGEAALAALAELPAGEAPLLRAEAWVLLDGGEEALAALEGAPPGPARAALAWRAVISGGELARATQLAGAESADEVAWARGLALLAQGASPREVQRAARPARGSGQEEALGLALALAERVGGLDWELSSIWVLGERSDGDARLAEALAICADAGQLPEPELRRACGVRLQRWLLPRLRYVGHRLGRGTWRELTRAALGLAPGRSHDALVLLGALGEAVAGESELIGSRAPLPAVDAIVGRRLERLSRVEQFWRACLEASPLLPEQARAEERRARLGRVRALFPPLAGPNRSPLPEEAWANETRALITVYLMEGHRLWEEAWQARGAAREAALSAAEGLVAELAGVLPKNDVSGDWRVRVLAARVALLQGRIEKAVVGLTEPWIGGGVATWRLAVELEVALQAGELGVAAEKLAELRDDKGYAGWGPYLHNTSLFLAPAAAPGAPRPVASRSATVAYPFPWRDEAWTRALLERGWRPGQPLLPLLEAAPAPR